VGLFKRDYGTKKCYVCNEKFNRPDVWKVAENKYVCRQCRKHSEHSKSRDDSDMPEGLRRLQETLERRESLESQKKDHVGEKTGKSNQAKKGFFKNIFKKSKTDQEDTPDTVNTHQPSPTRTFANDEDRILNSDEPYEILGVSKNHTFEQITQAYKKLQKNYLEMDLRDKATEERKRINALLIRIDKAYASIRGAYYANLNRQSFTQKPSPKFTSFHSEEDRILNSPDPFQILNVSPHASVNEIKKIYKELQLKYKLTGMINKPDDEVQRLTNLLKKVNWAYTEIKKINGFS
jgi:DnaJ-domain-containing protein 1